MKTVFKVGMKVYDQIVFPDKQGVIIDIEDKNVYPVVVKVGKDNLYYRLDGAFNIETIPTLSTKPYKLEMQGFEQKAPAPTYEEAVKWCIENLKDYRECVCTEYVNEKQENALEAFRKLIIFRDYYNEGWQPDWSGKGEWKFCIVNYADILSKDTTFSVSKVMIFKTEEIRDKFLEEQKELLEIAKPLL